MQPFQISASVLAADFARLGEESSQVIKAGADILHIDVMDNHYVPNLTMGPSFCKALRHYGITAPMDVHLMVKPVDRIIPDFAMAGATHLIFHPEASEHVDRTLQLIRDVGCRAGLALNPATPLDCLDYVLHKIDRILIMSVNPGFGGQQFIPAALTKIKTVRRKIDESGLPIRLEVDGGINLTNLQKVIEAGADTFVMGTAIFSQPDYAIAIEDMRKLMT